jgi:hypothetical protein
MVMRFSARGGKAPPNLSEYEDVEQDDDRDRDTDQPQQDALHDTLSFSLRMRT